MLVLPQEHPLWQRAWELCSALRGKAAYLARQIQALSSRLEDRIEMLEQRGRLQALVGALCGLEALLQGRALHPAQLHLELSRALGALAALQPGALPPLLPAYRHEAPRAAFLPLLELLEQAVASVSQEHRLQPFDLRDGVFTQEIQPAWLGTRLVLGLRGQSERDLVAWMDGAAIASASNWSSLRERRVLGAPRRRIEAADELGLSGSTGYTLFEVDARGGLVLAGEALQVANLNADDPSHRPREVVLFVKGSP